MAHDYLIANYVCASGKHYPLEFRRFRKHRAKSSRKRICISDRKQWYFTKTVRIPEVDHPVRLVIQWARKNGKKPGKLLVANRVHWEITRILNDFQAARLYGTVPSTGEALSKLVAMLDLRAAPRFLWALDAAGLLEPAGAVGAAPATGL